MKMDRRKFLKICGLTTGTVVVGGTAMYMLTKESKILDPFVEATEKVIALRFDKKTSEHLMKDIWAEYEILHKKMPYIGGSENIFTEWLIYGVYYLGLYKVLKNSGRHKNPAQFRVNSECLVRLLGS